MFVYYSCHLELSRRVETHLSRPTFLHLSGCLQHVVICIPVCEKALQHTDECLFENQTRTFNSDRKGGINANLINDQMLRLLSLPKRTSLCCGRLTDNKVSSEIFPVVIFQAATSCEQLFWQVSAKAFYRQEGASEKSQIHMRFLCSP